MKKNWFYACVCMSLCFIGSGQASEDIPEPYRSINDLPFDPHGWFGNGEMLEAIFKEKPIKTIVEIGSWLGASTRFLAVRVPEDGKVYAVDTWLGSQEPAHIHDPRLSKLYQLFLSNIKHFNLTHKVVPVRMTSHEAAIALNVKVDLVYIDGAHDTATVYDDIISWDRHLNEGGIMCGDDWLWPTVRAAVEKGAATLGKSIFSEANFWRYY